MNKTTLAGWTITCNIAKKLLLIEVSHEDNSPVVDTEADIGSENELGYRLTTKMIENAYQAEGEAYAASTKDKIKIESWELDVVVDADNHLNIYCKNNDSHSLEYISQTNGTEHSKECEILLTHI